MAVSAQDLGGQPTRFEALLEMSRQRSRIQLLESLLSRMTEACAQLIESDSVGIRVVEGEDVVPAAAREQERLGSIPGYRSRGSPYACG